MKPLIVLLVVFAVAVLAIKLITQHFDLPLAARIAMCAMMIFTAIRHVDYEKGTCAGKGVPYLWVRVPLQIFFIVWTYLGAIKMW